VRHRVCGQRFLVSRSHAARLSRPVQPRFPRNSSRQTDLPDIGHPREAIQLEPTVEVHGGGIHHLAQAFLRTGRADGLDGAHPHAAVEPVRESGAAGGEEVHGPAVQVHAVDEIGTARGRFAEVLARWVVGVTDGTIAVLIIDGVLAPDVALAHVDALVFGQVTQVRGSQEAGDHRARAVAASDDPRDHGQAVARIAVHLLARIVGVGEVAARDEGDLVSVARVEPRDQIADRFVVLAPVPQGAPTQGPSDARAGPAGLDGRAERRHVLRRMAGGFVHAEVAVTRYFDLVDPNHGREREETVAFERRVGAGAATAAAVRF
jgi:hypothetical protein